MHLWPGYQMSIQQCELGILLNCDIVFKRMHEDTVHDFLLEAKHSDNFQYCFLEKVLGLEVTTHDNLTYRIDDVDFQKTPQSTFQLNGETISYLDYYAQVNIYHLVCIAKIFF